MRKNFPLIYELLDEVMDYGVPQSTNTEALKTFVINDPVVVAPAPTVTGGAVGGPGAVRSLLSLNKGPTGDGGGDHVPLGKWLIAA